MMKKLLIVLITIAVISCNDFDIKDQGFDLEALPESVSFNGEGDNISADDSGEEGDDITIEVEATGGTLEPIDVTYTLGGTATFGVDYTIDGATAAGGTVTIELDPGTVNDFDNGAIVVELLNDRDNGEVDETVVITLVSATRGNESIEVGRGGTSFGAEATVTIEDVPLVLDFSASSLNSVESSVGDTLTFFAELSFATDAAVTYDFNVLAASSITAGVNYNFATGAASISPGTQTIAAQAARDTIQIVLVDNGLVSATTNAAGQDSARFNITNASVPSGDIWVGAGTTGASTEADTVDVFVRDDFARYQFTGRASDSDTIEVDQITVYNYEVMLMDTVSNSATPAFADVTVPYTTSGTATALDFVDITGGSVTIPQGESSANISIQVLRVGEATPPTLTVVIGDGANYAEVLPLPTSGTTVSDTLQIRID